jgi:GT2 family glycosyltransferase/nucleoside-diphosphate-sugar epimerase
LAKISVIIVNHNAGMALANCLASVVDKVSEVVVVDNFSEPDNFAPVVSRFEKCEGLRFVRLLKNTGFSAGCNAGVEASSGEYLLFLNPDCICLGDLFEKLAQFLDNNPQAGIVGGMLLGEDGKEQGGGRRSQPTIWRAFTRASGLWRLWRRSDFHLEYQKISEEPVEVDAVSGACLMIRREVFKEIGGFDEGYFLHCEDLDLCVSAKRRGWQVFSCPAARVFHSKGVCGTGKSLFVEWHKHKGMLRFFQKHIGHGPRAFLKPIIHAGVWIRFAAVCAREKIFSKGQEHAAMEPAYCPRRAGVSDIGVVGASSFLGGHLLPLARSDGWTPVAFSRNPKGKSPEFDWRPFSASGVFGAGRIPVWIALCPITALPQALPLLELAGVERLVAVSSTSRFTKKNSRDPRERIVASNLEKAEEALKNWAAQKGVSLVVLRTTLTYDGKGDANIATMARFIRKFQCLPVLFPANGLRQPLHAQDVAKACLSALRLGKSQAVYDLSGGETLTYLEMAGRVFDSVGIARRFIKIPRTFLRALDFIGNVLPRGLRPPTGIFERMNADLVFDHGPAVHDLKFNPRNFEPPSAWKRQ